MSIRNATTSHTLRWHEHHQSYSWWWRADYPGGGCYYLDRRQNRWAVSYIASRREYLPNGKLFTRAYRGHLDGSYKTPREAKAAAQAHYDAAQKWEAAR
jgi:hypothetical protein